MRRHSLGRSSNLQSLFRTPWPMTPHVRESHCHLLLKGKSRKRNGFERLNRLTSLEKQGQTLAVSADEEAKVWGKTVQTIPAEQIRFVLNGAVDTLLYNANLQLWRKESDTCPQCGESKPSFNIHV